jgi:hypothetical protein
MKQISGLDAAYGELCTVDEGPANEETTDIWEANRILRDLVSITRAESVQGALFQLALAREEAGLMTDNLPALASTGDPEIRAVHLHQQRLVRLLNSVAHVLRKIIGDQAADEAVGERLGDRTAGLRQEQDSLRIIEEAIANKPVGHLSRYA